MCELPRRLLGSTGLQVAAIGVGTGPLGFVPTDAEATETLHTWLASSNANLFDTSPSYGISERRVGAALADVPRARVVLQSKCRDEGAQNGGHSPFSRAGVLASVRQSLMNLRTPWLDTLLLHDPYVDELGEFLGPGGGMDAVRELRSAGLIRHFGLGCREHEPHLRLLRALGPDEFQVSLTVDDHNLMCRFLDQQGLREALATANVGLINGAPLYRGLLTEQSNIYSLGMEQNHPSLTRLSGEMLAWTRGRGASLLHLAVQFPLAAPDVPVSIYGCSSASQVRGLLSAATTPLPPGLLDEFQEAFHAKIQGVPPEEHFYWFKKQRKGNIEWPEMAAYPRASFSDVLLEQS